MSTAPYQLMNGPFSVYIATPVVLAPDIAIPEASLDAAWSLLGVDGDKDITEEGVKVLIEQDVQKFRGLGSVAARKMFRTSQDVTAQPAPFGAPPRRRVRCPARKRPSVRRR